MWCAYACCVRMREFGRYLRLPKDRIVIYILIIFACFRIKQQPTTFPPGAFWRQGGRCMLEVLTHSHKVVAKHPIAMIWLGGSLLLNNENNERASPAWARHNTKFESQKRRNWVPEPPSCKLTTSFPSRYSYIKMNKILRRSGVHIVHFCVLRKRCLFVGYIWYCYFIIH